MGARQQAKPGRLLDRREFLAVRESGRSAGAGGLVLQALARPEPAADAAPIRYGLTASRKVGNAVARNRARRRLRALADGLLKARGLAPADYVLIARQETATRPWPELEADLIRALGRVGCLKG